MTKMYRRPYRAIYDDGMGIVTFSSRSDLMQYVSKVPYPPDRVQKRHEDGSWSVY